MIGDRSSADIHKRDDRVNRSRAKDITYFSLSIRVEIMGVIVAGLFNVLIR